MTMKQIELSRIEITVRNVPAGLAEAAVRQLGPALAREISARLKSPGNTTAESIDAGKIAVGIAPVTSTLRDQIARSVASAVTARAQQQQSNG